MADKNSFVRWLGKLRTDVRNGVNGAFTSFTVLIDNPEPESQYNKGFLLWCDKETGEKYLVKQISLAGVSEDARAKGFINSLKIDLSSKYDVTKL